MQRSSSKCCDHVEKTSFRVRNHRLYFIFFLGSYRTCIQNGFPEFASGSSLPVPGSYQAGSLRPR